MGLLPLDDMPRPCKTQELKMTLSTNNL